eukprot:4665593-Prymnesium_polylepis.1
MLLPLSSAGWPNDPTASRSFGVASDGSPATALFISASLIADAAAATAADAPLPIDVCRNPSRNPTCYYYI